MVFKFFQMNLLIFSSELFLSLVGRWRQAVLKNRIQIRTGFNWVWVCGSGLDIRIGYPNSDPGRQNRRKEKREEIHNLKKLNNVYPGSDFFPSRIRTVSIPDPGSSSKNLSILTPKSQKNGF
jgi:hypothetical protein